MSGRAVTTGESGHNSVRDTKPPLTRAHGYMLEELDLNDIVDGRVRTLVTRLLNLLKMSWPIYGRPRQRISTYATRAIGSKGSRTHQRSAPTHPSRLARST